MTTVPRGTVVTECSGRAQLPCDSRSARNGCHGMLMEPCSGRQPRCLKKLTKIALAHFAWPFIVATTMIPQQSITKNHCLGSTRRFHVCIDIDPNKVFSNSSTLVNVSGISWPLSALSTNISSLARRNKQTHGLCPRYNGHRLIAI